jgi:hypothetical protein
LYICHQILVRRACESCSTCLISCICSWTCSWESTILSSKRSESEICACSSSISKIWEIARFL